MQVTEPYISKSYRLNILYNTILLDRYSNYSNISDARFNKMHAI